MTKKDYVLIAQAIKESHTALCYATTSRGETDRAIEITAQVLASYLKKENPKFNSYIFERACGITNN